MRVAAAGLAAPPAPLHYRVEPGGGPLPLVVPMTDGGVTFLRVTVDLSGFTGETYGRRIVAGWVQPSPENWGLERWKAGIPSMRVYEDHDLGTDGDWVFWTSVNNRDQEWTRLLNGNSVDEGTYTFGGRAWETESPYADRSLGPHLLLFSPRFSQVLPRLAAARPHAEPRAPHLRLRRGVLGRRSRDGPHDLTPGPGHAGRWRAADAHPVQQHGRLSPHLLLRAPGPGLLARA